VWMKKARNNMNSRHAILHAIGALSMLPDPMRIASEALHDVLPDCADEIRMQGETIAAYIDVMEEMVTKQQDSEVKKGKK